MFAWTAAEKGTGLASPRGKRLYGATLGLVRLAGVKAKRGRKGLASGLAVAAMLATVCGCGTVKASDPASEPEVIERSSESDQSEASAETVAPSDCPAGMHCRSTEGRILYVERVDPDGDGDAHFVIFDSDGVTLPGLTAIDVGKGLRPHPLPETGDLISAAGPVQTGSLGQSQIHAIELHVAHH